MPETTAFICRGRRAGPPACGFCHKPGTGTQLCDYPIGGTNPETGLKKTCDQPICKRCAASNGGFDYCPDHRQRAGLGPAPKLDLSGARWLERAKYDGSCVMMRCGAAVEAGSRCLYVPSERAVTCEPCGEELMK